MGIQIAVAGKGGTGKTSFCALLIRYLINNKMSPVLAIDADANANLNEALGIEIENETVSELIAKTKEINGIPKGMTQETFIEYKLNASLAEGKDVDLLVMGGPDGPGCYCFPNNILRKYLESMTKSYSHIVMDNEAGLEHISRRTTQDIDYLFIISDNSVRSIRSAGRAYKLVKQIKTNVKKVYLIITRATDEELEKMKSEIEKTELELAGIIPDDKLVKEFDIEGKALYDLPDDSKAVIAVEKILKEKLKGQV